MSLLVLIGFSVFTILSCKKTNPKEDIQNSETFLQPVIKNAGKRIEFPKSSKHLNLFVTKKAEIVDANLNLKAPATVIGKVKSSEDRSQPNLVLFSSTDLTSSYSQYLQNLLQIQISKTNFNRTKDLYEHGAATGKELNDSSSSLYTYQSTLAENEAKLRREGFNPKSMKTAQPGTVWLVSDLPESELNILHAGLKCTLEFPSYPSELFQAKIDAIAEVLNMETKKARVRIVYYDNKDKLRPGMFGKVKFEVRHNGLMVKKSAVFTSNALYYVFIKTEETVFEIREVTVSSETDELLEIAGGIKAGDEVVEENVYLLKGLAFGI